MKFESTIIAAVVIIAVAALMASCYTESVDRCAQAIEHLVDKGQEVPTLFRCGW